MAAIARLFSPAKGDGAGAGAGAGSTRHGAPPTSGAKGRAGGVNVNVRFILSYQEDGKRESVHLVGSLPQLGNWVQEKAKPMKSSRNGNWFNDVLLPLGSKFQYRYFIRDESSGNITYESGIQRAVALTPDAIEKLRMAINVVDVWQFPSPGSAQKKRPKEEVTREHRVKSAISHVSDEDAEELERLRKENKTLTEAAEDAIAAKRSFQSKVEGLAAELERERARANKAAAGLAAAACGDAEVVATIKAESSALKSDFAAAQKSLDDARAQIAQQKSAADEAQGTMETELAALRERVSQLEGELSTQAGESEDMRQEMLDAMAVAKTEGSRADALSESLAKARVEAAAGNQAVEEMGIALAALREEHEAMRAATQLALETTQAEFGAMTAALMPRIAEKEAALTAAKARIADVNVKLDTAAVENRELFNQVLDLKGNIRVFARIRPQLPGEAEKGNTECVDNPVRNRVLVTNPVEHAGAPREFAFDRVFGKSSTQEEVFDEVRPLVQSVLDGYNVCVFAYGQTGSGKTHTMLGSTADPGVNLRAVSSLFDIIKEREGHWDYGVAVSMFEIYNESVRDLLSTERRGKGGDPPSLEVRQSMGKTYVDGLTETDVASPGDVQDVISMGHKNRSVGRTNMNQHSSRSHLLMSASITGLNVVTGDRTHSHLYLIDLAGSERLSRSGATGASMKEAQHINKSLSALGDVMNALQTKSKHVPYRNSKLTYLLQDALGGDAKCLMMCQVAPGSTHLNESTTTLQFALRTASVELGRAKKNETSGAIMRYKSGMQRTEQEVNELRAEVERQRAELKAAKSESAKLARAAEEAMASAAGGKSEMSAEIDRIRAEHEADTRNLNDRVTQSERAASDAAAKLAKVEARLKEQVAATRAAERAAAEAEAAVKAARTAAASGDAGDAGTGAAGATGDGSAAAGAAVLTTPSVVAEGAGAGAASRVSIPDVIAEEEDADFGEGVEAGGGAQVPAPSAVSAVTAPSAVSAVTAPSAVSAVTAPSAPSTGDTFASESFVDGSRSGAVFADASSKENSRRTSTIAAATPGKGAATGTPRKRGTKASYPGAKTARIGMTGSSSVKKPVLGSSSNARPSTSEGTRGLRGSKSFYDPASSAAARRPRTARARSGTQSSSSTSSGVGGAAGAGAGAGTSAAARRASFIAARNRRLSVSTRTSAAAGASAASGGDKPRPKFKF